MKPKPIVWNGQTFGAKFVSEADLEITPEADKAFAASYKGRMYVEVLVDKEKEIIDGRRQLLRAVKLKLPPERVRIHTIEEDLTDEQKRELRDDINHHRRSTTRKKLREIIARRIKVHPILSDSAIAKMLGTTHDTVGKVRKALERAGEIQPTKRRTDSLGRSQPAARKPPRQTKEGPSAAEKKTIPSTGTWTIFKKAAAKVKSIVTALEEYSHAKKGERRCEQVLAFTDQLQQQINEIREVVRKDLRAQQAEPATEEVDKKEYFSDSEFQAHVKWKNKKWHNFIVWCIDNHKLPHTLAGEARQWKVSGANNLKQAYDEQLRAQSAARRAAAQAANAKGEQPAADKREDRDQPEVNYPYPGTPVVGYVTTQEAAKEVSARLGMAVTVQTLLAMIAAHKYISDPKLLHEHDIKDKDDDGYRWAEINVQETVAKHPEYLKEVAKNTNTPIKPTLKEQLEQLGETVGRLQTHAPAPVANES